MLLEKRCTKSGEVKPFSEFHRHPQMRDGRHSACAACIRAQANARAAERRAADLEAERERQRQNVARFRATPKGKRSKQLEAAVSTETYRRLREAHPDEYEAIRRIVRYELTREESA